MLRLWVRNTSRITGASADAPVARMGERGAAAVEAAVLLPIMLVILWGGMEVGNIFSHWMTIQKAAQVATRFASTGQGELEGNRMTRILSTAQTALQGLPEGSVYTIVVSSWPGIQPLAVKTGNAGNPCETVQVKIQYEYKPIIPWTFAEPLFNLQSSPFQGTVNLMGEDRKINEPWQPCL